MRHKNTSSSYQIKMFSVSIFTVTSYSSTLNFERRLWYSFSFKSYWSESTDINVAINFKTPVFEGLKRVFVQIMVQLILPRNRAPKNSEKKKTSKVCSKMCFDIKFSITQFNPTWPGYGLTVLCKKRWLTALGKKSVEVFILWTTPHFDQTCWHKNILSKKIKRRTTKTKTQKRTKTNTKQNQTYTKWK